MRHTEPRPTQRWAGTVAPLNRWRAGTWAWKGAAPPGPRPSSPSSLLAARLSPSHDSALLAGCRAVDTGSSPAPPAASTASLPPTPALDRRPFPSAAAAAATVSSGVPASSAARPGQTRPRRPRAPPAMQPQAPGRRHTPQRGYAVTRSPHLNKVSPPAPLGLGQGHGQAPRRRSGRRLALPPAPPGCRPAGAPPESLGAGRTEGPPVGVGPRERDGKGCCGSAPGHLVRGTEGT